jgi:MoaA/NifB/PqqE/SkfB family radical SAM enzyme
MNTFKSISIELTKKCNLSCRYCYAGANQIKSSIDINQNLLYYFFDKFKNAGGKKVLLTGGEVFLHKNVLEIIEHAYNAGLIIDVFTNGTLVLDEHIHVLKKYVNQIFLSLDGPESVHNHLSCVPDSYKKTYEVIKKLSENKISINLQTMIVPDNINDYGWLLDIIRNIDIKTVVLSHVSSVGKGLEAPELILDNNQMMSLLKASADITEKCNFKTRIVTNIITNEMRKVFYNEFTNVIAPWMMPNGNIYSCYNTNLDYWKLSDYKKFPLLDADASRRLSVLSTRIATVVENMEYFDLFQIINTVSDTIIKEGLQS